jgi:hypothetical protein
MYTPHSAHTLNLLHPSCCAHRHSVHPSSCAPFILYPVTFCVFVSGLTVASGLAKRGDAASWLLLEAGAQCGGRLKNTPEGYVDLGGGRHPFSFHPSSIPPSLPPILPAPLISSIVCSQRLLLLSFFPFRSSFDSLDLARAGTHRLCGQRIVAGQCRILISTLYTQTHIKYKYIYIYIYIYTINKYMHAHLRMHYDHT